MIDAGLALAVTGGGAFLTVWAVLSLLVVAATFAIMLRATYVEWRNGSLW